MEWVKSLLGYITSGVNFNHPEILLIILTLTIVNEIGFPLFFAMEILLFFISYQYGPLSAQSLLLLAILLAGREIGANSLYFAARGLGSRYLDWLEKRSARTMRAVEKFKLKLNDKPVVMVAMVRITPGLLQVPSVTAGVVRLRLLSFFEGVALSSLINELIVIFLGFSARFLLPRMDTQPKTYLGVSFGALIAFVWIILFLLIRHKSNKHHPQKERVI